MKRPTAEPAVPGATGTNPTKPAVAMTQRQAIHRQGSKVPEFQGSKVPGFKFQASLIDAVEPGA